MPDPHMCQPYTRPHHYNPISPLLLGPSHKLGRRSLPFQYSLREACQRLPVEPLFCQRLHSQGRRLRGSFCKWLALGLAPLCGLKDSLFELEGLLQLREPPELEAPEPTWGAASPSIRCARSARPGRSKTS